MSAPLSEKEVQSGQDLLAAMGNIMASWQSVEHAVLHLYLTFFRPYRIDSAVVVFYAVRTFDARLTLVDALIAQYCNEDIKAEWGKVFQSIRRKGTRRNAVAHGLVTLYGKEQKREYRIGSTPFDLQRCPDPTLKQASYSSKELLSICMAFNKLSQRIMAFATDVGIDAGMHPEFAEPQPATRRNEARYPLQIQTEPAPSRQPKPSRPSPQNGASD